MSRKSDDWKLAMEEKGHTPVVDEDGHLDMFVYDHEPHNGPGCSTCGWRCCWFDNCTSIADIPVCKSPQRDQKMARTLTHNQLEVLRAIGPAGSAGVILNGTERRTGLLLCLLRLAEYNPCSNLAFRRTEKGDEAVKFGKKVQAE